MVNAQTIKDDLEGNENINTWKGDDCFTKTDLHNPLKTDSNNSFKVLEYSDNGGLHANVGFDLIKNLNL